MPKAKGSAKALSQRADRAYAEFERMTRHISKVPKSEVDGDRRKSDPKDPGH